MLPPREFGVRRSWQDCSPAENRWGHAASRSSVWAPQNAIGNPIAYAPGVPAHCLYKPRRADVVVGRDAHVGGSAPGVVCWHRSAVVWCESGSSPRVKKECSSDVQIGPVDDGVRGGGCGRRSTGRGTRSAGAAARPPWCDRRAAAGNRWRWRASGRPRAGRHWPGPAAAATDAAPARPALSSGRACCTADRNWNTAGSNWNTADSNWNTADSNCCEARRHRPRTDSDPAVDAAKVSRRPANRCSGSDEQS